jgi:transcriptional regulator GlxA family with amidase domain
MEQTCYGGKNNYIAVYAMPTNKTALRRIVLIGFNGVQSLDLVGPADVFAHANASTSSAWKYDVTLASPRGGEIVTNAGLRFSRTVALREISGQLDTIIVAGGSREGLTQAMSDTNLLSWLRKRASATRRIASVCTGAFVLAAAGFLDGRRATTHWGSCARLQKFRPAVEVDRDAIFVAEPPFFTSAGVTAGIDLCLSFVEADCGPATALAVAKELVLFMRRPGGQSQFSAALNVQAAATPKLRTLVSDLTADPSGDLSLPSLARRAAMTERTFSRVFHKEIGMTPAAFVESARVDRAKALLETSDWPLARVAERSGFRSLDTLHRAFLAHTGATPGEYRERFGARAE